MYHFFIELLQIFNKTTTKKPGHIDFSKIFYLKNTDSFTLSFLYYTHFCIKLKGIELKSDFFV